MTSQKPATPTADAMRRDLCDQILERAAETMMAGAGAPVELIVDRMATYTVAQMLTLGGKDHTIAVLHDIITQIESGAMDKVLRPDRVN